MLALPLAKPLPLVAQTERLQSRPQDLRQQMPPRYAFRAADNGVRHVKGGEDGLGDGRLAGGRDAVDDHGGRTGYRGLPGRIRYEKCKSAQNSISLPTFIYLGKMERLALGK